MEMENKNKKKNKFFEIIRDRDVFTESIAFTFAKG